MWTSELGEAGEKSWGKFNPMQMRGEFRQQRPIRLFGVVSDGLKIDYGVVQAFHLLK